jgi:hypothetical protein
MDKAKRINKIHELLNKESDVDESGKALVPLLPKQITFEYCIQNLPPTTKEIESLWHPQLRHLWFTYIINKRICSR